MTEGQLRSIITAEVKGAAVFDMHTHLYAPEFRGFLLWGIDELLTYHYLAAEALATDPMPPDKFYAMPKEAQAQHVWDALFVKHSPLSESTRGIVTIINKLGLDPRRSTLAKLRKHFATLDVNDHIDNVFRLANLEAVVMTNDPFDDAEQTIWKTLATHDPRFLTALRIDPLLNTLDAALQVLARQGYRVGKSATPKTLAEIRRFLDDHADRIAPLYMAASMPPTFRYPDDSDRTKIIEECLLPFARERNLPFALMLGVKRQVNPALRLAGDSVGRADLDCLQQICQRHPQNKFLVTCLALENQHELCVLGRKFPNLMLFGCWWFVNMESSIREITARRLELLGTHFIPQHSDARVLEQVIYKWSHTKEIIADVLTAYYTDLLRSGWTPAREEIRRDICSFFSNNFKSFIK